MSVERETTLHCYQSLLSYAVRCLPGILTLKALKHLKSKVFGHWALRHSAFEGRRK